MSTNRIDDLLVSTANELKEGRSPLNGAWLCDHDVTADECFALADMLVTCIHTYRATMQLAVTLSNNESKFEQEDDSVERLAMLTENMKIRQGGPFAIIATAAKLEAETA